MDGSAVSCGIVFDAHRERWRVWIVCNRELSSGGPLFDDEDEAVAWAHALRRDWSLEDPAIAFRPLFRQVGDSLARLREKSVS